MKQTIKTILKAVKGVKGNSLAEFATTTALMATLAATAAPKLSEMSEGTKGEKSRNEIDKIVKQGGTFYQDMADLEGRGRFPGQDKHNVSVGGPGGNYDNKDNSTDGITEAMGNSAAHLTVIENDLGLGDTDGWRDYDGSHDNTWASVFGTDLADGVDGVMQGYSKEWLKLFSDDTLRSPFQDGHYVYTVVAGGGSGTDVYPPVLFVGDIENMVDFNNIMQP